MTERVFAAAAGIFAIGCAVLSLLAFAGGATGPGIQAHHYNGSLVAFDVSAVGEKSGPVDLTREEWERFRDAVDALFEGMS